MFAVVMSTAFVVGLGAPLCACVAVPETSSADYGRPAGIADRAGFVRAGTIRAFSVLAGGVGIITASVFLVVSQFRSAQRLRQSEQTERFGAPAAVRPPVALGLSIARVVR